MIINHTIIWISSEKYCYHPSNFLGRDGSNRPMGNGCDMLNELVNSINPLRAVLYTSNFESAFGSTRFDVWHVYSVFCRKSTPSSWLLARQ